MTCLPQGTCLYALRLLAPTSLPPAAPPTLSQTGRSVLVSLCPEGWPATAGQLKSHLALYSPAGSPAWVTALGGGIWRATFTSATAAAKCIELAAGTVFGGASGGQAGKVVTVRVRPDADELAQLRATQAAAVAAAQQALPAGQGLLAAPVRQAPARPGTAAVQPLPLLPLAQPELAPALQPFVGLAQQPPS